MDISHNIVNISKAIRLLHHRLNHFKRFVPLCIESKMPKDFLVISKNENFADVIRTATIADIQLNKKSVDFANQILNGEIEILGGKVILNPKINWHTDYKCGYTWGKGKYYTKYKCTRKGTDEDVKTVWDLSRCHFVLWLSEAFSITKEEKYAKRSISFINDWINENPYNRSINWTCAMDVAIRAANWIYSLKLLEGSELLNSDCYKKIFKSLFLHGRHIYETLENDFPYSANHYMSDIVGLVHLGYLFKDTKEGKKWLDYSLKEFFYEVRLQTLPSGANFERSISYHRLTTELILYTYLLIKQNSPEYNTTDISTRIEMMLGFIHAYTKPNGLSPNLADNDNGRLLPLECEEDYRAHTYLLKIAKDNGLEPFEPVKVYKDAGFAFLRNKGYWMSFTNTGISKYNRPWKNSIITTHTHQDSLSFEVSKNGVDFIIDPGTYIYTSSIEKRDEFRSTRKHNTVSINESNPYNMSGYFNIETSKDNSYIEPTPIQYWSNAGKEFISGEKKWQKYNVIHKREIEFGDDGIIITDTICNNNLHSFEWNFHFDSGVEVVLLNNATLMKKHGVTLNLSVSSDINFKFSIADDTVSPSYGVLHDSKTLRICSQSDSDIKIKILIS